MAALISLEALTAQAGSDRMVGFQAGQNWKLLARRRAAWAAVAGGPGDRIGLYLSDGFEFAAALLGAWSVGAGVLLLGEKSLQNSDAVRSRTHRRFIGDAAAPPETADAAAPAKGPFPSVPLVVFTSGSAGEPVAIDKTLPCIQNELTSLETAFGAQVDGTAFLATVSHQHYYGLLFKILWPLAASRRFLGIQLRLPEEIAAFSKGIGPCTLVTSPALLKRMGVSGESLDGVEPAHPAMQAVFSSGGPLPWDAARRCRLALGQRPTEVYGSSETGGVAWRRRQRESDPWTPLPGVEVAVNAQGVLELRSEHCTSLEWAKSDDRAVAVPGGFRLLGRVDRIVKLEEKRVSLAALERALLAHPRVSEARVLVLKGSRELLAAVICPKGGQPQGPVERRDASLVLRRHLEGTTDAAALPRRWRFVDRMPMDSMGKTTRRALEALFIEDETREPECLYVLKPGKGVEIDYFLPQSLVWFKGHFPGHPLLAGVVQLHWAIRAAREHLDLRGAFKGLKALKFMRPVRPGQRLSLALTPVLGGFEFSFASEEGKHSSGRVLLG